MQSGSSRGGGLGGRPPAANAVAARLAVRPPPAPRPPHLPRHPRLPLSRRQQPIWQLPAQGGRGRRMGALRVAANDMLRAPGLPASPLRLLVLQLHRSLALLGGRLGRHDAAKAAHWAGGRWRERRASAAARARCVCRPPRTPAHTVFASMPQSHSVAEALSLAWVQGKRGRGGRQRTLAEGQRGRGGGSGRGVCAADGAATGCVSSGVAGWGGRGAECTQGAGGKYRGRARAGGCWGGGSASRRKGQLGGGRPRIRRGVAGGRGAHSASRCRCPSAARPAGVARDTNRAAAAA